MSPSESIISWFRHSGRKMEWRNTRDPYRIWLAEIIMQQTRIETGVAYFHRFIERFPDLPSLASAERDEVLKYWEGLGYYSRARNLHTAAQQLMDEFGGEFPETHTELIKLKGVGPYTSRAIASFAFDEQVAVVDGNVLRVSSRYLGDADPIDEPRTRKKFQAILDEMVAEVDSREFNHAMMDIGAMVCTPTSPACMICPLENSCIARAEGLTTVLPRKGKKLVRKTRYFQFVIPRGEGGMLIRQRPEKGLWGGLWEIPNREVSQEEWERQESGDAFTFRGTGKHVFTHFDMHYQVFEGDSSQLPDQEGLSFVKYENLPNFAFPRAVLNMFNLYLEGETQE